MTPIDLELKRLAELEKLTTKGPWKYEPGGIVAFIEDVGEEAMLTVDMAGFAVRNDWEFIAAIRNAASSCP